MFSCDFQLRISVSSAQNKSRIKTGEEGKTIAAFNRKIKEKIESKLPLNAPARVRVRVCVCFVAATAAGDGGGCAAAAVAADIFSLSTFDTLASFIQL